jgi:putative ABC transport system permease protein
MSMLGRKLRRDLWRSKWLLLAITSIIAVGVLCFVSMQSAYHNLDRAKQRYYRQCRMADFWIELKKAPLSEIRRLGQLPGIRDVRSRIQFFALVDLPEQTKPVNAAVISLPDRREPVINDLVLRRGHYFTSRRDNQVIVSEAFARRHRLVPGDWVHLLLNNRRQEFLVVGTGISSEFTYLLGPGELVPNPESFGIFYIKQTYAEEIFDFQGAANQVVGSLAAVDPAQRAEALRQAELLLEPYGVIDVTPLKTQASNQFLTSEIDGLGAFATVVPTIFLVVAALILNVLIHRLTRQQRTVIGTLKALGYRDRTLFLHFLGFGLVVGMIGGSVGCGLGYLSATGMTAMYRVYFEFPELRSDFYWYTNAVGLTISLVCAALGSLHGAWTMLRLQAAEAMRPEPPRRGGAILLEAWAPGLWRRLDSGWRMALRSVFRSRLRTTVGMFAAAMGTGLLMSGFMLLESQFYLLDFQFERISRADVELAFQSERDESALDEVGRLPGVDLVEPLLHVGCTLTHGSRRKKTAVMGLVPDSQLTVPRDTLGRRIALPEQGCVISRRLASILDAVPGDRLTMTPSKGERRPVSLTVARVADSYLGLVAYADLNHLSRLQDEAFVMTGAQLKLDPRPAIQERLFRELKRTPSVRSVSTRRDTVGNLRKTLLETQWVFIGALVLFAGLIFFGSVLNASMVNLAERQREVGTLLALGYDPWRVGNLFLRESLVTNTLGTALGLPFGYFLAVLTAASYNNDLIRLPVVSPPWTWITTILLAAVFGALAHSAVQLRIRSLDFVQSLKVKE